MKQKFIILIFTSLLFLIFATPTFAQGPEDGGQVIFGRNYTMEAEQTVDGDVVVFGGNLAMPASARITGDLAVFGGNVKIDGTVEGDIAVAGGNANLGETAVVEGDLALLGGSAHIDEGAIVAGEVFQPFGGPEGGFTIPVPPPDVPPIPSAPSAPAAPRTGFSGVAHEAFNFFEHVARNVALIIGLAAVSWLVAIFMPAHMKQVSETVATAGPVSFGMGLVTTLLSLAVGIPLLITICLAPVSILVWFVIGIAGLFGWVVIGQMIGEKLLDAAGQVYPNPVYSTILGTVVLTILWKMPGIQLIPCIGWIFWLLGFIVFVIAGSTGLGAVILTRFGTRPYTSSAPAGYGGPASPPRPGPAPETDFSDLEVNAASEAELKAKIEAALAEADRLKAEIEAKKLEKTKEEPPAGPEPDLPNAEDTPEDEPDNKPRSEA